MTSRSSSTGGHPALGALTARGDVLVMPARGEIPVERALLSHPRVVMTSHVGVLSDASVDRSTVRSVEGLLPALDGHAD